MDVSHLLDSLNDAQRSAVTAPPGHVLVLAGAGSGKTRVLTHRIAWLHQVDGISPFGIVSVTFTNKAAAEMRARLEAMLEMPLNSMWVGTFHGLAHRFLRLHWQEASLPQGFQILDGDDQLRMVKRVTRRLELDETRYPPKQSMWYINAQKDEGLRPAHIEEPRDAVQKQLLRIYTAYEADCQAAGVIDFAELLLRALETLRDTPALLSHYQRRFAHILVDEFQDTNAIQYAWLRLLAGDSGHVFAVGDDDQSIYGWRGAKVENILHFTQHFPTTETIRLEQNYRSTGTILKAANSVIANNGERLGKKLWTNAGSGEPISLYAAYNEHDEARFVVERIEQWLRDGGRRDQVAVLYRSNAQSRVVEESLIAAGMPYRVYGGLRFFERAEIKDALAYLRLICNRNDDVSFERVVNQPTRGVGDRSVSQLREIARARQISLWQACDVIEGRARAALLRFRDLILSLDAAAMGLPLAEQVAVVIEQSGLLAHYQKDKSEKGKARVENLQELKTAAQTFDTNAEQLEDMEPLEQFLANAALEAGELQGGTDQPCVQMMTLHSAKGLEFPLVFLIGMEEGLFPHQRSVENPSQMQEERRLCYVGITRAETKLFLSLTETRRLYGREQYNPPSRFIHEIPSDCIEDVRPRARVTQPAFTPNRKPVTPVQLANETPHHIGQLVHHERFGEGVVIACEGSGSHTRIQVNFSSAGPKWLVLAYAKLSVLA